MNYTKMYEKTIEGYLEDLERYVKELRDSLKREDYGAMIRKYPDILTTIVELQYETHYADMYDRYPD